MLPDSVLTKLEHNPNVIPLVRASSDELQVLGTVTLSVNISGYNCRQPFVVVRSLTSDAILGTVFIDAHVENVWLRRRRDILTDGTERPIERRPAWHWPRFLGTKEAKTVDSRLDPPKVSVAKPALLEPRTETGVLVHIPLRGSWILETNAGL